MDLSKAQVATLAAEVAGLLHKERHIEASRTVAAALQIPKFKINPGDNPKKSHPVLLSFLHQLMGLGMFSEAAQMLWTPNQFTPSPGSVQEVWKLFEETDTGLIMGAARLGKSFSMGVRLFLEWVRDPKWTGIRVLGPSENHLEQNLFSHLVSLHQHATLPMPGEIGDLFIGMDRRDQLSSIRGVVIPKGNTKKAGRLQGGHRRPRPQVHPVFGELSRMFIFIDEIENVPDGVWMDIDNVLSELDQMHHGFKLFGAYNPSDPASKVAQRAEPIFGWENLDEDKHFRWKSVRGWDVLRLDGERCENVVQKRVIYAGLQTVEGLEKIAINAGGRQAPGYRTMGRGLYPLIGLEATVIAPGMLGKARGEFVWYNDPLSVGACDLALEGGDECVYTIGKWGLASGIKYPPSIEYPNGRTVMFKDGSGGVVPRYGLLAEQQFVLPKGETVAMKNMVLDTNRKAGVMPLYFSCDRTGHGAGVADLIRYEWSSLIHDVNYSEGAGEDRLMMEDTKTCKEQYERMYSVLWFAMRTWMEFGYLLIHPQLDMGKLSQQLCQRRFRVISGRHKVESKKDYKARGFQSPGEADSLSLLVHAARRGSGVTFSMRGARVDMPGTEEDDWTTWMYPGGVRVDDTNRTQHLDTTMSAMERLEHSIL
jgi:hypothetical protein